MYFGRTVGTARKSIPYALQVTNNLFWKTLADYQHERRIQYPMALVQKMLWCELARRIFLIFAQGFPGHGHGDECGVREGASAAERWNARGTAEDLHGFIDMATTAFALLKQFHLT
jgi:hypothetical protein